jgi:hypothetical protein
MFVLAEHIKNNVSPVATSKTEKNQEEEEEEGEEAENEKPVRRRRGIKRTSYAEDQDDEDGDYQESAARTPKRKIVKAAKKANADDMEEDYADEKDEEMEDVDDYDDEEEEEPAPKKVRKIKQSSPRAEKVVAKVPAIVVTAKLKALVTHLKSKVKTEKFFDGGDKRSREFNVEEMFTANATFKDLGDQTQPTPENNPNSKVLIRQLSKEDLQEIFGKLLDNLKCPVWRMGDWASYQKGYKLGSSSLDVIGAQLKYSMNSLKVTLKVSCINEDDLKHSASPSGYHSYHRHGGWGFMY